MRNKLNNIYTDGLRRWQTAAKPATLWCSL